MAHTCMLPHDLFWLQYGVRIFTHTYIVLAAALDAYLQAACTYPCLHAHTHTYTHMLLHFMSIAHKMCDHRCALLTALVHLQDMCIPTHMQAHVCARTTKLRCKRQHCMFACAPVHVHIPSACTLLFAGLPAAHICAPHGSRAVECGGQLCRQ